MSQSENVTATFEGQHFDNTFDVITYILGTMEGEVWVAIHCEDEDELDQLLNDPTVVPQLMGVGICWARDDEGRLHYVVEAAQDPGLYLHAETREDAWELAVSNAYGVYSFFVDDEERDDRVPCFRPRADNEQVDFETELAAAVGDAFDLAYDERIDASTHGDKADLLALIPANYQPPRPPRRHGFQLVSGPSRAADSLVPPHTEAATRVASTRVRGSTRCTRTSPPSPPSPPSATSAATGSRTN